MTNVRRPIHLQLRPALPSVALAAAVARSKSAASTPLSPTEADSLPSQVMQHLFVGDLQQTNRETLNRLNISYVLSLGFLPLISNGTNTSSSSSSPATTPTNTTIIHHNHQHAGTNTVHGNGNCNSNNTSATTTALNAGKGSTNCSGGNLGKQLFSPAGKQQADNNRPERPASNVPQLVLMPQPNTSIDFRVRVRTAPASNSDPSATNAANIASVQTPTQHPATELVAGNNSSKGNENKAVKAVRSIQCKCINIADNSDQMLAKYFDEAHQFIDEARRKKCNVLVHCFAGISRSPTIVIAYLMRVQSLSFQEAYNLVKRCRPQIDPNLSFMSQLMLYERHLEHVVEKL